MARGRQVETVVVPAPPYGDVGPISALVARHPYLDCYACGSRLWHGATEAGAGIYACRRCGLIVDERRVS